MVRRARHEDLATVAEFTRDTFPGWGDYIPAVFHDWVEAPDGVLLAVVTPDAGATDAEGHPLPGGRVIAVARIAFLSSSEAWLEGIRVDPQVRGLGVATDLQVAELRWAAAHGVSVMRYLTGERNEGSHRLGAKHGFGLLGAIRWYGWDEDREEAPPAQVASNMAPGPGAILGGGRQVDAWWEALVSDPTIVAAQRLYEPRSWSLQALTRQRFDEHVAAGDVVIRPASAIQTGPGVGDWGLVITRPEPEGEEDPALPPAPAAMAGDGRAVLEILRDLGGDRPGLPAARLPDPDPALLADGVATLWSAHGWRPHDRATHVFERPIDGAHPIPEPDVPGLLTYGDEPRASAVPRRR